MTACFCGCGEPIGLLQFSRARANKSGMQVTRRLADLDQYYRPFLAAGRPGLEALASQPDVPDPQQFFDEKVVLGNAIRTACIAEVHGQPGPEPFDIGAAKKWLGETEGLVQVARFPLDVRQRLAAALSSGTFAEVAAAIDAGRKSIGE